MKVGKGRGRVIQLYFNLRIFSKKIRPNLRSIVAPVDILDEVGMISSNEDAVPDGRSVVSVHVANHTGIDTHTKDTFFLTLFSFFLLPLKTEC